MAEDYKNRSYLSAIESAQYLGMSVRRLHGLVRTGKIKMTVAVSGQQRFDLKDLESLKNDFTAPKIKPAGSPEPGQYMLEPNETVQRIFVKNSAKMDELADDSIHLMITSPPYFNAKMYSQKPIPQDLGNIHDLDEWFEKIGEVWREVYRVLQPGRKAFINIMNLPVREETSFRTLNLAGKTVDLCEKIGFIFKRDIIWHKTNSVRAHFGTYPYPGGILLNHMHEFILEFQKPAPKGYKKYAHLTDQQKELSKLEKEFWVEIKKSDVWVMKPVPSGDNRSHIAPFPYELPFRLIKAYSYVSETILDPFLGSGTTLLAAADLKRNGVGYEINPEIVLEAVKSLKRYQGKLW